MTSRSGYSLTLLTAAILVICGQTLLLIPPLVGAWRITSFPFWNLAEGLPLVLLGVLLALALYGDVQPPVRRFLNVLAAAALGFLSFASLRSDLLFAAALTVALVLGNLATAVWLERTPPNQAASDWLDWSNAASSLAVAAILIARPASLIPLHWQGFQLTSLWMGSAFALGGIFSGAAIGLESPTWKAILVRLAAIPWLLVSYYYIALAVWAPLSITLSAGILLLFAGDLRRSAPASRHVSRPFLWVGSTAGLLYLAALGAVVMLVNLLVPTMSPQGEPVIFPVQLAGLAAAIGATGLTVILLSAGKRSLSAYIARLTDREESVAVGLPPVAGSSAAISETTDPPRTSAYPVFSDVGVVHLQPEINQAVAAQEGAPRDPFAADFAEVSLRLESVLEPHVAAQLVATSLQRTFGNALVTVLMYDAEEENFIQLATFGPYSSTTPMGYRRDLHNEIFDRAIRLRKTQVTNHGDHLTESPSERPYFLSQAVVPLVRNTFLQGVIVMEDRQPGAFSPADVARVESLGAELLAAWERAKYHHSLNELIRAGLSLSIFADFEALLRTLAEVAQRILQARFVYVALVDQDQLHLAWSGEAPHLVQSLGEQSGKLLDLFAGQAQPAAFRLLDTTADPRTRDLGLGEQTPLCLLASPVLLRHRLTGAILAFGKRGGVAFSDSDEMLANLIANQAAIAIESSTLNQELRSTLKTTELLYALSNRIAQSQDLQDAAAIIAETAHNLAQPKETGLVLLSQDGQIQTQVHLGAGDGQTESLPMALIRQTIQSRQPIHLSDDSQAVKISFPIQTPRRCYGALWMEMKGDQDISTRRENLSTIINQAAVALERAILLDETTRQAGQIAEAFSELETTYDQTLAALMSALDARDRETEGHSLRVANLAVALGRELNLPAAQLKALERGALLHDIGKIGVTDAILNKPGPLSDEEWSQMRRHADIGAHIVSSVPFLKDALPVIRYHQERWDGSGYPDGLAGEEIPLLARIFAVSDAYDALTHDRPYRERLTHAQAMEYLHQQAAKLFDPTVVEKLDAALANSHTADDRI